MQKALPDEILLRLNAEHQLIPDGRVAAARKIQKIELSGGSGSRTLLEILRSIGTVDEALEAKLDELVESPLDLSSAPREPSSSKAPSTAVLPERPALRQQSSSVMRRPPEVDLAAQNPQNLFAHFIMVREVGRGGMGTVYRAFDTKVGRIVALKIMHTTEEQARQRFHREAQIAGRLKHPSIATVYEVGEYRDRSFLSMQYIDGQPLGKKPDSIEATIRKIRDAARGLHYAHTQGIVHRDVKPGNLLESPDGIFVTDFGVAKEIAGDLGSQFSMTGVLLGTPDYMSPEQARGITKKIDARSDVYSLGSTLYALLANRTPFEIENQGELLISVIRDAPPPLSSFNKEISPALEMTIQKAMAKDTAKRHQSAEEFADDLDRLLAEKRFVGKFGQTRMLSRRWMPRAAAAVVIAVALRFAIPALFTGRSPAPTEAGISSTDVVGLYSGAVAALTSIESAMDRMSREERHDRLARDVITRIELALARNSNHLPSRVTLARAKLVDGRGSEAATLLNDLTDQAKRDYRIPFLRALLAIDEALKAAPPLPAPEAPFPDWDSKPAAWPSGVIDDLKASRSAVVLPEVQEDFKRDDSAALALLALAESRWEEAAIALTEVVKQQHLPVYAKAWCRAAYMARRFQDVALSPRSAGSRERTGSSIAVALQSARIVEDLQRLDVSSDPGAAILIQVILARSTIASGRDPEVAVKAGLGLNPPRELKGVLLGCRIRWLAFSGQDGETLYQEIIELLGASPTTWMGRLSAMEARLGLGTRLDRRRAPSKVLFQEVIDRSNRLVETARDWAAPRVLRGQARVRQGQLEDAWAELAPVVNGPQRDTPALLAASSLWLQLGEERRRAGRPITDEIQRVRDFAVAALASAPDHPEGLNLAAAGAISLAESAASRGKEEATYIQDAISLLEKALAQIPDYIEGRLNRANALFLRAEMNSRNGKSGGTDYQTAIKDLDVILARMPEISVARHLRGILYFVTGRPSEAAADWKRAVTEDPSLDSDELRSWVQQAEASHGK